MAMFGSRGAKGGKFSVEDLYGISKKPKASSGPASSAGAKGAAQGRGKGQKGETDALASQILEAAHRLVERRRLELYLRECGLSINDCQSERQAMLYR
ncbi:voltage-gated potassium channel subunit beta-2-like isoform X2 [Labeo rohita]|nr:voltage-gated potassium channel subunit beta-2-like isoform X2 [Labeo rohita]